MEAFAAAAAAAVSTGSEVVIKHRKKIRRIAVLDLATGFVTLVLLSCGLFPIWIPYGDKKIEDLVFYLLVIFHTLQEVIAIILFNGTDEKYTGFPWTRFKTWRNFSKALAAEFIIEICFIFMGLEGMVLVKLLLVALCICKCFVRLVFMIFVEDSMEDLNYKFVMALANAMGSPASSCRPNGQQAPP